MEAVAPQTDGAWAVLQSNAPSGPMNVFQRQAFNPDASDGVVVYKQAR